jgi:hypothetical protein
MNIHIKKCRPGMKNRTCSRVRTSGRGRGMWKVKKDENVQFTLYDCVKIEQ